ncbi:MAG: hypothetical protein QW156_05065 [Candidatus Aenigmatarchaeota archaeon]
MAIRTTSIRGIKTPHTDILPSTMNSFLAFGKDYTSGINLATDKFVLFQDGTKGYVIANKDLGLDLLIGLFKTGQLLPYPFITLQSSADARHIDISLKDNCSFSSHYDVTGGMWHLSMYINGSDVTDTDNLRLRRNSDGTTELGLWLNSTERAYFKSDGTTRLYGSAGILLNTFAKVDENGAVYMTTHGNPPPPASATYRNALWVENGGAGVADKLYVCLKSATDTYSWVLVATG